MKYLFLCLLFTAVTFALDEPQVSIDTEGEAESMSLILSWEEVTDADFYNVYLGPAPYNGFEPFYMICDTEFQRTGLVYSSASFYQVTAKTAVEVPDDGLIAHWDFNFGSGSILYDQSGHNLDCSIHGAVWDEGISGSALWFDGEDDYAENFSDPAFTPVDRSWSVSAWFMTPGISSAGSLVSWYRCGAMPDCGPGDDGAVYSLSLVTDSTFYYHVRSDPHGNHGVTARGERAVADIDWHFMAGVFDTQDLSCKVYIDGILMDEQFDPGFTVMTDDGISIPLEIGRTFVTGWGSPGSYFSGALDEIRIYGRALSWDEVQSLYYEFCR